MTCASCGDLLNPTDRFCEACGEPTDLFALTSDAESRRQDDRGPTAAVSDRGRVRARNEDAFALAVHGDGRAVVVCDGVATTTDSELAAGAAAGAAIEHLRLGLGHPDAWSQLMIDAIHAAQAALGKESDDHPMASEGSTTIVAALARPGQVVVGNVGDSRAYWIGENSSSALLSTDDTWAREAGQRGISSAEIRASRRAHEITGWLGPDAGQVDPHIFAFQPPGDGVVVVCSDGLWNYAESPDTIAALVRASAGPRPLEVAQHLVEFALGAGGGDNVTVAVADISTQQVIFGKENPMGEENP
jgi:serine/threonine protein phosphatase PrpC